MARCGCAGSCSCVIQGASPVAVTGNGSPQQPYIISLGFDGETGCAAITACVAENLGPGLVYDDASGEIQVALSSDAGNTLTFGTDGKLKNLDGIAPTPAICVQGIADLPAAPSTLGAFGLAQLMGPYSSPAQVEYCLGVGVDIIHFRCATSSDDVGVVSDLGDHRVSATRTSLYVSEDIRELSSATIKTAFNYAGDVDDPVSFTIPEGGDRTDRRGGWYGFLAQTYYQPLATDFLSLINGKAVALLDCVPDAGTAYPESVAITGAIRAVLQYCAQGWAFIGVGTLANATTVNSAGLKAMVMAPIPATWGTTALPYTTAALTAAGVEWITLSDRYADSVFTTYRTAGFQVLMSANSRHQQRTRVTTLNIRGALVDDPVYYRGPTPFAYRTERDPWQHRRMGEGGLTHRTDGRSVVSNTGLVRGRMSQIDDGIVIPEGFGNTLGRPSLLCGWLCPLTDGSNYTIAWDMKWNNLATVSTVRPKMGLLFGAATDQDPYDWPQADAVQNPVGYPAGQRTMYRVYQRQNGEIGIMKWASPTAGSTFLATLASPAISAGNWNSYLLTVTPTQITFRRTLGGGATYTVTAADSQYRGGYVWIEKEEGTNGDTPSPFEGVFRNLVYTDL